MSYRHVGGAAGFAVLLAMALSSGAHGQVVVFETDFEAGVPASISPGSALVEGVQGYAGLGPAGSQFGGSFLRSATGNLVTLTLTDLPPHDAVSLGFLFAAIDSLDGTGTFPQGDFFRVTVDGNEVFRESFANALASQVQSYVPPAGGELARRVNLGFTQGSFHFDSAYDMNLEPAFSEIPHSAPFLTVTFQIEGPGIQDINDESWGIDQLRITVRALCTPDLAAPFGVLNFFDLAAYLSAYNSGDPTADLAAPLGVLNFFDLAQYLASYNAGCP
jgi:hypothetical protein